MMKNQQYPITILSHLEIQQIRKETCLTTAISKYDTKSFRNTANKKGDLFNNSNFQVRY